MIVSLPSRNQLLAWIAQLTNTNVERIEQLSDGVQFCEVFDKIYPKIINLNKLKKDPKVTLEKEKNFRLLLNAVNHLGLCVSINIVDLSLGKVGAVLQLLQWFYKQYRNPSVKIGATNDKEQKFHQPRMIKSYVGNLIVRQKSCQKEIDKNTVQNQLGSSRRSLDSKLLQKNVFKNPDSKSVRSKSIHQSQHKPITQKKENPSKTKSVTVNQEIFQQKCQQRRSQMKRILQNKKSERKEQKREQSFMDVINSTINFEKPKLHLTLIKVTQAALENNPQLQAKLRMALQNCSVEQESPKTQIIVPLSAAKSNLPSYMNTSQKCENDTLEQIQLDTSDLAPSFKKQALNRVDHVTPVPIFNMFSASKKKQVEQDKKETVKKSTTKYENYPPISPHIKPQFTMPQISAQKDKNTLEIHQQIPQLNQNIIQNQPQNEKLQISHLFNPHLQAQKAINPETYVTQKKTENRKQQSLEQNRRLFHSQNLNANIPRDQNNVWQQPQQSSGPYPDLDI